VPRAVARSRPVSPVVILKIEYPAAFEYVLAGPVCRPGVVFECKGLTPVIQATGVDAMGGESVPVFECTGIGGKDQVGARVEVRAIGYHEVNTPAEAITAQVDNRDAFIKKFDELAVAVGGRRVIVNLRDRDGPSRHSQQADQHKGRLD